MDVYQKQLTQVAPTLVSLAAVFWMSRNAPGCERDYSHPRPGSLRVYQIRFRFFIFLHYFKRLLQNLQYNKIHKSSKVKCAQRPKELVFRVGHSHVQLTGIDRHLHTRWVFKRYTLYCL